MPFLFIDYDQGIGGEFFCANLSKSDQCVELLSTRYNNQRTKVHDIFGQEFLKPNPQITTKNSHDYLYDIVPSHRNTYLARQYLSGVSSIRIANPTDQRLWQFVINQRINKVFLSQEPNSEYFLGQLKILRETARDPDFIRKVNSSMDLLSLKLLAEGIEPTESARQTKLTQIKNQLPWPEPDYEYDCILGFEDLVFNPLWVKGIIYKKFNINIEDNWLDQYSKDYREYCAKT